MAKRKRSEATYMHPAFGAAMRLELRMHKHLVTFQDELHLGAEPNIIDLLVIKLDKGAVIDTEPWTYLRQHNIFEFKSPRAGMSIDDFYKSLGRACEYKALGRSVNAIRSLDMTLTMVREARPVAMMRALREEGSKVDRVARGVYAVRDRMQFETRMIVYGEMDDASCGWLRGLSARLTKSEAKRLIDDTEAMTEKDDTENANALLYASMRSNRSAFSDMTEEGQKMLDYRNFKMLFGDLISQEVDEGRAEGIALGEARGIARGAAEAIISMCREFSLPKENILARLIDKLGCSRDDAERMLREA